MKTEYLVWDHSDRTLIVSPGYHDIGLSWHAHILHGISLLDVRKPQGLKENRSEIRKKCGLPTVIHTHR